MSPKVFVSHASEDKERFVLAFAERLRQNGVDAWLDKWEMLPGDSLVDKIFEEGLKSASAVIVVLSRFSVTKPWVREELNTATVNRISRGCRLIPVVIDDCEVPECLKSTLWERIEDLGSYDHSFNRIVGSVFGLSERPPLGQPPRYARSSILSIGGLSKIDSLVLRLSCEATLATNGGFLNHQNVLSVDDGLIAPERELIDSLEILDQQGYVELSKALGERIKHYRVTDAGFEIFARDGIADYDRKIVSVMASIANEGKRDNRSIADALELPKYLVNHILELLHQQGAIRVAKEIGGRWDVYSVSPLLRRKLEQMA